MTVAKKCRRKIFLVSIVIALVSAVAAAGCNHSGRTVNISGSSTVEPISVRVAELVEDSGSNIIVNIDGPGTGDGFKLFCEGETDISDASREIKASEVAKCRENGIDFIELQVAIDGIAVITSAKNDAVDCLSLIELYSLIGPEATGTKKWADANNLIREQGGGGNLPSADLDIFGPGEESGTFDSFVELAIEEIAEHRNQDITTRPDYNTNADDNVIIRGVQNSDTSLGWIGYAFAKEAGGIKLLSVASENSECVEPTATNIADGTYPIARPLLIYVNKAAALENEALRAYVDFYLQDEGLSIAVGDVGYVELDNIAKTKTRQAWRDGLK